MSVIVGILRLCLKVVRGLPLVGPIAIFSWDSHKKALIKGSLLWLISTSPVIFAIFLSTIPQNAEDVIGAFFDKVGAAFSLEEQYIYAATFLAPPLILWIDRWLIADATSPKDLIATIKRNLFSGYLWVWSVSFIILIFTVVSFTSAKTNGDQFRSTYLYYLVSSKAYLFYMASIYCWYLALLDAEGPPESEFSQQHKRGERQVVRGLQDRVSPGSEEVDD